MESATSIPGMTLMGAIDLLRPTEDAPVALEADMAVQNTASINELNALMAGVQRK